MGILKNELLLQWRRQRWVLLAAACTGVLFVLVFYLAWPWPKAVDTDGRVLRFFLLILWYATGSSAGVLAFAEDFTDSAGAVPGKRPFGILLLKMSIGLTTLLLAVAILILVPVAFYLGRWDFHGHSAWFILECADLFTLEFLLAFGSGSFLSSRGGRPAVSIIASTVISVLLFVVVSFCWLRLDLHEWPTQRAPWIRGCMVGTAMVLLVAAFRNSARRRRSDRKIRSLSECCLLIALATVLVSACFISAYVLAGDGDMELYFSAVSPTGREVLVSAHSADDRKEQIWVLPVDPERGIRIIRRQAYDPVLSPDGSSIIYFSQKTWYGLISGSISLRYCRIDGSGDRVLVPDFTEWARHEKIQSVHGKAFSADGTLVALNCGQDLYVVRPDGRSFRHIRLDTRDLQPPYYVVGFATDGDEVLLRSDREHRARLFACNPQNGKCNLLFQSESLSPAAFDAELRKRGIGGPFPGKGENDIEVLLGRIVADPDQRSNYRMCVSPDGQTLFYTVDSEGDASISESRIHRYRTESGTDELIAAFPGKAGRLGFSPSGNEIAIFFWGPRRLSVVLGSQRVSQIFEGWDFTDWIADGEVLLMQKDRTQRQAQVAVGDTATGRVRTIYP